MGMAQLLDGGPDFSAGAVTSPVLLDARVAKWGARPVLLGPEHRAVSVAGVLQVAPDLRHQAGVVQEHRTSTPTLAEHVDALAELIGVKGSSGLSQPLDAGLDVFVSDEGGHTIEGQSHLQLRG
jgi:hypothetical protein